MDRRRLQPRQARQPARGEREHSVPSWGFFCGRRCVVQRHRIGLSVLRARHEHQAFGGYWRYPLHDGERCSDGARVRSGVFCFSWLPLLSRDRRYSACTDNVTHSWWGGKVSIRFWKLRGGSGNDGCAGRAPADFLPSRSTLRQENAVARDRSNHSHVASAEDLGGEVRSAWWAGGDRAPFFSDAHSQSRPWQRRSLAREAFEWQ